MVGYVEQVLPLVEGWDNSGSEVIFDLSLFQKRDTFLYGSEVYGSASCRVIALLVERGLDIHGYTV